MPKYKIDPRFAKPAFDARHPMRGETQVCQQNDTMRTDIFRPLIGQVEVGMRASAWPRNSANVFSIAGTVTDVDTARQRVQMRIYQGGTMECLRWFAVDLVAEVWRCDPIALAA